MPKIRAKIANPGKRVIVVFGPPASGVSTMLDVLKESSESSIAIVPYHDTSSMQMVEAALNIADIVMVDVDGGMLGERDVQEFVDNGYISAAHGAVIRIYTDYDNCLTRADKRPGYITKKDLELWDKEVLPIEAKIRFHNLPYFMLPNHDLEEGVRLLALRSNIMK